MLDTGNDIRVIKDLYNWAKFIIAYNKVSFKGNKFSSVSSSGCGWYL